MQFDLTHIKYIVDTLLYRISVCAGTVNSIFFNRTVTRYLIIQYRIGAYITVWNIVSGIIGGRGGANFVFVRNIFVWGKDAIFRMLYSPYKIYNHPPFQCTNMFQYSTGFVHNNCHNSPGSVLRWNCCSLVCLVAFKTIETVLPVLKIIINQRTLYNTVYVRMKIT